MVCDHLSVSENKTRSYHHIAFRNKKVNFGSSGNATSSILLRKLLHHSMLVKLEREMGMSNDLKCPFSWLSWNDPASVQEMSKISSCGGLCLGVRFSTELIIVEHWYATVLHKKLDYVSRSSSSSLNRTLRKRNVLCFCIMCTHN